MKVRSWIVLLSLISLLGCTQFPFNNGFASSTYPHSTNPESFDGPDVTETAINFLEAWENFDYPAMYALLTSVSRDALSLEEFERHFQGIASEAALENVSYEILSSLVKPDSAQVSYKIKFSSVLVGDITRETVMNLSLEKGDWRVQWDDTLVIPELKGGNYLSMDRDGYIPSRANIYDRTGRAMVGQADTTALGLYPDQIDPEQTETLFALLTQLTGLSPETIQGMYANFPPGAGWYLPLGEVPANSVASNYELLSGLSGLIMRPYKSRFYFDGGVAPHVIGYVSAIQPEEVQDYQRRGYQQDERVGRSGLEQWGEPYLAGKRGGALYVLNAQGHPVTRLAEADAQSSQAIYTTLDKDFQTVAQKALSSFRGAVVVLERDTGRVLAMVSSPSFDPNAFEPINLNSSELLSNIINDPSQPLFNRAAQGQYPLGSVFKIITMAAALESGLYTPETTYHCGYFFEELPGVKLNDWTYDYFQENGKTQPSGTLTLPQGLIRSCNPFFWHIGLDLFNQGMETVVPEIARGFGLGSSTGIEGVDEAEGQILVPSSPLGATNMAIGQGDLLVTPLQVANFVAAIGNGGTLYQPQVVERIAPPDGDPTYSFEPKILGELPVDKDTLSVIQGAMVGVIRNEKPRGTAWHRFTGLDVPVAGKTGTSQTGSGAPHAWFAGYTFAEQEDRPDIAIAVVIENIGEGSDYAAPIFRRIVELYFSGQPQKLYWWESEYYVTSTPQLNQEGTPIPWVEATPEP
jgi:penicillin-binding protein 2